MGCDAGWQDYISKLTDKVAFELGVSAEITVQAQLYKLLLYQTGDHFVAHRDTEKSPGMFATMTVVLPSQYTVSHVCTTPLSLRLCTHCLLV